MAKEDHSLVKFVFTEASFWYVTVLMIIMRSSLQSGLRLCKLNNDDRRGEICALARTD